MLDPGSWVCYLFTGGSCAVQPGAFCIFAFEIIYSSFYLKFVSSAAMPRGPMRMMTKVNVVSMVIPAHLKIKRTCFPLSFTIAKMLVAPEFFALIFLVCTTACHWRFIV